MTISTHIRFGKQRRKTPTQSCCLTTLRSSPDIGHAYVDAFVEGLQNDANTLPLNEHADAIAQKQ
eukprot:7081896-Pyramimonas_sp.AAC.1